MRQQAAVALHPRAAVAQHIAFQMTRSSLVNTGQHRPTPDCSHIPMMAVPARLHRHGCTLQQSAAVALHRRGPGSQG